MNVNQDFNVQISQMLAQHLGNQVRLVGGAVLQLQRMVVDGTNGLPGTPRDTHQAASNWFVDVNQAQYRESSDTSRRNLGLAQATVATALARPEQIHSFILHNSLPYIKVLEYGLYPNPPKVDTGRTINGFSTQAPQGFFRIALQRWQAVLTQVGQP